MRLIVSMDGEHTISVSQTDERCFNRHSSYEYSNCRISVARIEKDSDQIDKLQLCYLNGNRSWDRETHVHFENLKAGEYYVYIEMDWNETTEDLDFCATCYGASKSYFLRDEKQLFDKNSYLRSLFASRCISELDSV